MYCGTKVCNYREVYGAEDPEFDFKIKWEL